MLAPEVAGLYTDGRVVADEGDLDWIEIHGFDGTPLACQQQLHLDFGVDDLDTEEYENRVSTLATDIIP
ncbi:hypothetical protein GCM10009801_44830 [Streptomyces albiaxialis]|uniref:Uncharacterized protein n=1 Tax=Streptomyces albiaxialis TaxID=329523 RepID=A0ABN2W8Q4_9ACTN